MTYTEKNREYIYRFREKHPDKYAEQRKKDNRTYYLKNRERILENLKNKRLDSYGVSTVVSS
jgi:hypothetical protein